MFSAPLWLYALATLAIPLALHLWSRRPRQVIRVGSLRHITDLTEARSWSARLTEPLLLLLRLGVLASIVFALAGPRVSSGRLTGAVSQLVLVEPALLDDSALVRADPLLDSLARSRATVRLLEAGLPRVQLDGVENEVARGTRNEERQALWDLLVSADRLVSRNGEILVIARPRIATLGGRRPALRARVHWHVPLSPSRMTWSAARWRTVEDSLLILTGQGDTKGARYRSEVRPAAVSSGDCTECAEVPAVAVWIAADDSNAERRLLLAARAVGELLGQPVKNASSISGADLVLTTSEPSDSLFRLDRPVASLSQTVIASAALADTVLAHWPWRPLSRDYGDPRESSVTQALPESNRGEPPTRKDARVPLLLLALVLFTVERWLSTRPVRPAA